MKKLILIAIATTLLISTTACSNDSGQTTESSSAMESAEKTTEVATELQTTTPTKEIAGVGEFVQGKNFKITLTDAKVYDEIKSEDSEYLNEKAKDGCEYLVLFLEAENTSSEDQNINIFYYDAYADDKAIEASTLLVQPEGYSLFSGDVASGKKLQGFVAYELTKGWQKLEFTYKDGLTSDVDKYSFAVNASDIG